MDKSNPISLLIDSLNLKRYEDDIINSCSEDLEIK